MSEGGILAHGAVAIGGALIFLKLCADDMARRRAVLKELEEELFSEAKRFGITDSDGAIAANVLGSETQRALKPRR